MIPVGALVALHLPDADGTIFGPEGGAVHFGQVIAHATLDRIAGRWLWAGRAFRHGPHVVEVGGYLFGASQDDLTVLDAGKSARLRRAIFGEEREEP